MKPRGSTTAPHRPVLQTDEEFPVPPQQARSREKRKKLLEAGRILFGQKGYEATSIEDVTSRAGTSAGSFYQYFRSKRQLLLVLMNELLERLGSLDLRPIGAEKVRTGLRSFLAGVFRADFAYYGVVRAWQEAALADAEFGLMQEQIESWTQARVLAVFQSLQQLPNARRDQDLPAFAAMMDRHFWRLLARGSSLRPSDFEREVNLAADVIYHYLFSEPTTRREP
jgi:AcrR family transcriptional regulator